MSNFLQAIKWMREGKKVKRKGQVLIEYWDNQHAKISYDREGYDNLRFTEARFDIMDFEATDWEIYEENVGLRTLKNLLPKEINENFNHESWDDKRKSLGYVLACEDLKIEAIKWIKDKLEWLQEQPSIFKIVDIGERNITFKGLSPIGNESEERVKGWIMGLVFFFNVTDEDLK